MTQMMMKASVAVVTFFLLFSSVAVLASELIDTAAFQPQVCCTRFNTDKIPENTVTGFKSSSKECVERGVIFERNSDPDICVDPSLEWVKKIIIGFQCRRPGVHVLAEGMFLGTTPAPATNAIGPAHQSPRSQQATPPVQDASSHGPRHNAGSQIIQPHICCTSFYPKKIPTRVVQSFRNTDILCPKRGVIIKMTNNKDICVDPSSEWVKKLVDVLQ